MYKENEIVGNKKGERMEAKRERKERKRGIERDTYSVVVLDAVRLLGPWGSSQHLDICLRDQEVRTSLPHITPTFRCFLPLRHIYSNQDLPLLHLPVIACRRLLIPCRLKKDIAIP